jgi:hypothetical protein
VDAYPALSCSRQRFAGAGIGKTQLLDYAEAAASELLNGLLKGE